MVLAIIQARLGSSRLPNKVLYPLVNKTVIDHICNRVSRCSNIDKTVIAIPRNLRNEKLYTHCLNNNYDYFTGEENDVLDRYYQCAKEFNPDHIVRITADCPLIDSDIIEKVIDIHLKEENDYTTNTMPPTYPDGLDVSIFSYHLLKNTWFRSSEREHVCNWMKFNHDIKKYNVMSKIDLSQKRWTLDYQEDYQLINAIYEGCYKGEYFGMNEVLEFLNKNPELEKLNSHLISMEYKK